MAILTYWHCYRNSHLFQCIPGIPSEGVKQPGHEAATHWITVAIPLINIYAFVVYLSALPFVCCYLTWPKCSCEVSNPMLMLFSWHMFPEPQSGVNPGQILNVFQHIFPQSYILQYRFWSKNRDRVLILMLRSCFGLFYQVWHIMTLLTAKAMWYWWQMHDWAWSIGGMILTGENGCTWRKTCPSATLSARNPTWTGLRLNLGLQGERAVTDHLNHGTSISCIVKPVQTTP
jgi:hypothetical protein